MVTLFPGKAAAGGRPTPKKTDSVAPRRRLVYSAGAAAPHQATRALEVRSSEDDVRVCAT